MDPLLGIDLKRDSCTAGQKSNHKKIIFNGDGDVGKTYLIYKLNYGYIPEYLGVPYDDICISYDLEKEQISKFDLCDTAGREDYDTLRPLIYPGTDLFCLCFSIASSNSFDNIQHKWIPEIRKDFPDAPIILMGCKIDLRKNNKALKELKFRHFTKPISFNEGEWMAISTGCCTYIESSAITGEGNVTDLAEIFAKTLIYYHHQRELFDKKKKCELM